MAPELRSAFIAKAEAFADFRITDYQIGRLDMADDATEADVRVTYRGYSMMSFVERPILERQRWFRESGNHWQVRPDFEAPIGPLSQAQVP